MPGIIAAVVVAAGLIAGCSARSHASLPAGPGDVRDLPLIEVPAADATPGLHDVDGPLAIFLTGDGGWAELDRTIARRVADHGIPVVGFNSRKYLEHRRTPEATATAIARVIRHYSEAWHRHDVVLIGYSRGADLLPFVVNRLPEELRERTRLVVLLAAAERAGFEFHWIDLIEGATSPGGLPILPEVERMADTRVLCFCGRDEVESLCRQDVPDHVTVIPRNGGHHFDGDYVGIADLILEALGR